MAHDKNGTPLEVGDKITIAAEITSICAGDDYCNLSVKSVEGRKPDGSKETFSLNAAVVEKVAGKPEEEDASVTGESDADATSIEAPPPAEVVEE